ncbi:hypothetical protein N7492_002164 [Penicillium capsulatum]|uniref:Myb-like domain-containing protein n=1 Tax=Penicillium capsulatum TaxID=69766 RepID=A0A9W9IJK0_9EURO|nr:hypothetical protein N7492_002164 [Penicillium capsulatum]KAJ6123226.1 hypothetical protein N7512_005691 [Penicillium capsulatum]
MVAVDLDNIVQYQPPATNPPCKAPSQARDLTPRGSAHSSSDTRLHFHQAPPYPWSTPYPLPATSSLQADTGCLGGFHSPYFGTQIPTNPLDDALDESPSSDLNGLYQAWTDLDHQQECAEILSEPGSTNGQNQYCLVGSPCGQGTCHQHDTNSQDGQSQVEGAYTLCAAPERDDFEKEIFHQPKPCLLQGRRATNNRTSRETPDVHKEAGARTLGGGKTQDGVGVHASSLPNDPGIPIASVERDAEKMVRKPQARALPETSPANKSDSQSTREDPIKKQYTMGYTPEDSDGCEIQGDTELRLASRQTSLPSEIPTLDQKEAQSSDVSGTSLQDSSQAYVIEPLDSHITRKRRPRAAKYLAGVSDSEWQDGDDPNDDDYLEKQLDRESDNDNPSYPRKRQRRAPTIRKPPHRQHSATPLHPAAVADKPNTVTDISLTTLHDVETIPVRGFLTRQVLFSKIVYSVTFEEQREHTCYNGLNRTPTNSEDKSIHPYIEAKRGSPKRPRAGILNRRSLSKDDQLLIELKEQQQLPWSKIAEHFPGRSKGSLQVRYSTRLKNRTSGNVSHVLDVNINSEDTARAPCEPLRSDIYARALSRARYGPSRTRRTVDRYSPS